MTPAPDFQADDAVGAGTVVFLTATGGGGS
jgi:hypothetical protein